MNKKQFILAMISLILLSCSHNNMSKKKITEDNLKPPILSSDNSFGSESTINKGHLRKTTSQVDYFVKNLDAGTKLELYHDAQTGYSKIDSILEQVEKVDPKVLENQAYNYQYESSEGGNITQEKLDQENKGSNNIESNKMVYRKADAGGLGFWSIMLIVLSVLLTILLFFAVFAICGAWFCIISF